MAPAKLTCSVCSKSHAKALYVDSDVCPLICVICDIRKSTLEEIDSVRKATSKEVASIMKSTSEKVDFLNDLLITERNERTSVVEALQLEILQLKKVNKSNYSDVVKSTLSSESRTNNCSNRDDGFKLVKNGARKKRISEPSSVESLNPFNVLNDFAVESPLPEDTVLVGDSMFRNQKFNFSKSKRGRRVRSYGGSSLVGHKKLIDYVDSFTKETNKNTTFIVHVGTNDLLNSKREASYDTLIEKYRTLLRTIKHRSKSNNICILGMLPVLFETLDDTEDRKMLNVHLSDLAAEEGVDFVSFWKEFAHPPDYFKLFNRGGLHLSSFGDKKLGNLLSNYVENFRNKSLQIKQT